MREGIVRVLEKGGFEVAGTSADALIAEGLSNAGVAHELVITTSAVERHVSSIFDKLGRHQSPEQYRRVLAVLNYLRS